MTPKEADSPEVHDDAGDIAQALRKGGAAQFVAALMAERGHDATRLVLTDWRTGQRVEVDSAGP